MLTSRLAKHTRSKGSIRKQPRTVLLVEALEDRTLLSSTLAYWRFEDGSGSSAADSSGNGNTGTLNNGATFAADTGLSSVPRTGATNTGALLLDGANDNVTAADSASLQPTSAITLEA